MGAHFFQPVKLINQTPQMGALNPWELHNFFFAHFAVPDPLSCVTGYSLAGDVPNGISVDGSGNIKGNMLHFWLQPSCQDNYPDEPREFTGSNWMNDGRFKHIIYDFKFTITAYWLEKTVGPDGHLIPCAIPGTTKANCIIRMCKDHNIDHKLHADKYAAAGFKIGDGAVEGPLQAI